MALTILIKFCGSTVHSKPNNMALSAIPGKIPETNKKKFFPSLHQSGSNAICRVPLQISPAHFLNFQPTLKIKDSSLKKQAN